MSSTDRNAATAAGVDRSVVGRAFRLLDAFGHDESERSLTELASAAGIPKATAHRLAAHLVSLGALERVGRSYRLGFHLFELGQLVARTRNIRESALPFMEDLYEAAHEAVHLGVLRDDAVMCLHRIAGHRKVATTVRVGGRVPAHCTALGKALLAFSPTDAVERVVAGGLPRRTPYTITLSRVLAEELAGVRGRGVAVDREESAVGVVCVAAPVFDGTRPVAALSVAGAAHRLDPELLAPAVRTAALSLGRTWRRYEPRRPDPPTRA